MATGTIPNVFIDGNSTGNSGYCKMPDGTLICWGAVFFNAQATGLQTVVQTFPHPFVETPRVVASWQDNMASIDTYFDELGVQSGSSYTTATQVTLGARRKNANYDWLASWIAIGHWK